MSRIDLSNDVHEIPVNVATRWHQLSILLGIPGCGLAIFALLSVPDISLWLIPVGAAIGFVLPPFLVSRVWPVRDTLTVGSDALLFSGRGRIPYSTITSYSTDDYLKLVRDPGATWILTSTEAPRLRAEFVSAIDAWQTEQGTQDRIIRRRFYGTVGARVLGCCLVAVSTCIAIFSWMIGANYGAMAVVGLGVSAAAVLLPKRA